MSFLKKAGLTAAFMVAADLVIASFTGLTGIHALVVDAGAHLGEVFNIPAFDWAGLMDHGEFNFLDPGTDLHAEHAHG